MQLDETVRDSAVHKGKKKGAFREYVESFFWAILFAFLIRSFIVEPYKIPSKSMVPTLLAGDHIFVNKFSYGLRIPGTTKWIAEWGNPNRGDVIVFIYPEDQNLDFIKRVVGLPGDRVEVRGSKVFINGQLIPWEDLTIEGKDPKDARYLLAVMARNGERNEFVRDLPYYQGFDKYDIKLENLGHDHLIQLSRVLPTDEEHDVVVPEGHFFVMGDNRDKSADSRVWGFVPRENLKGRALFIWLSLNMDGPGGPRWDRFGKKII